MKRHRVPPTTKAWPESRLVSYRHQRLQRIAEAQARRQTRSIADMSNAQSIGSKIQIAKPGVLSALLRRRTP